MAAGYDNGPFSVSRNECGKGIIVWIRNGRPLPKEEIPTTRERAMEPEVPLGLAGGKQALGVLTGESAHRVGVISDTYFVFPWLSDRKGTTSMPHDA